MNWDQVAGNWKQFKGHVKEKWDKLTDDHLDVVAGTRDQLVGKIQERSREADNDPGYHRPLLQKPIIVYP